MIAAAPRAAGSPGTAADRLDSWKEIAAYLRRGVRTVRRWEKTEGLPVHRHLHQRLGTVYAYKPEIDAWWDARGPRLAHEPEHETDELSIPRRRARRALVLFASVATGVAALAYLAWPSARTTPAPASSSERVMLAVLPFENLSGAPDQEFFSDGLTEEMITELGRLSPDRLGVIARTSTMPYKGAKKTVAEIAAELRVDYLLEGSVRREGDRVRITTQLIRASDQSHLWAENYDRDLSGVLDIQTEVSRAIADRIQVSLAPDRPAGARRARAASPSAHEAVLRGRYFLERRTADDIRKARESFGRAIQEDPGYALAYVGLADAHILSITYADAPAKESMASARKAVLKALEMDANLPDAHAWLGVILAEYDWNWTGAAGELRRAVDLSPNFAYAHKLYAEYLSYVGRFEQAIAEAKLARQLDPLSIVTNSLVGIVLYRARRYDEALAELERTIEMDPDHPMPYLPTGLAYVMKEMPDEALTALRKGLSLTPESSEMIAQIAYAAGRAGRRDEARKLLNELRKRSHTQHVSPFFFAVAHAGLGKTTAAVEWLEKAYDGRDWLLCVLKTEPILDPLRDDRRFQELLQRMNFPM
jgi:TolB-like protein/Tfp pilus assembly protein PilF